MRITRQILFYVEFNVASEICVNVIFIIDLSDDYDRSYLVSILFKLIRLFIHSFTYARTYSFPHSLNHSRNSPCMHDAGPQACQRRYPERNGRAPLAKILVESELGILDLSAQKKGASKDIVRRTPPVTTWGILVEEQDGGGRPRLPTRRGGKMLSTNACARVTSTEGQV